jgi:hypothetical protein
LPVDSAEIEVMQVRTGDKRFLKRIWEDLPVAATKRSRTLGAITADGAYLTQWGTLSQWAPLLCLVIGLVLGGTRFLSRGETFTFSVLLMCLLVAISSFGGSLGLWLTVGYSVSDFLFFRHKLAGAGLITGAPLTALTRVGLPALLLYFLLLQLLAFTPVVATALSNDVLRRIPKALRLRSVPMGVTVMAVAFLHGTVTSLLVYVWVHIVPTLIRPVYTWIGYAPPIQAIEPLQARGSALIKTAFCFSVVRSVVEQVALQSPTTLARVSILIARQSRVKRARKNLGRVAGIIIQALLMTFILSGLLLSWTEATIVLVAFVGLIWARQWLGKGRIPFVDRIRTLPLIIRFLVCAYIGTYVAELIVGQMWNRDPGFRSVWISVLLSLVLFSLFIPGEEGKSSLVVE